ncbi:DUF7010 family protein [Sphingomonas mesophila]|uniref:DUF7010 family protein n=1 Tax=Sphingomonas mesophila TaxID=2303576 RepID=UPI000E58A7F4|nr:hypothetical protein [Sphingomonas mesophila]
MTVNAEQTSLGELRRGFREGSTNSMPIAGMLVWAGLGIAALFLSERTASTLALYVMAAIMPLAYVLDRLRGRNLFSGGDDPLTKLFLLNILMIGLTIPLIVIGAAGGQPLLVLLGMAVLAGIIWIPYGWAADDPTGLVHGIARAVGCYLAYAFVPAPWTASAICAVVVLAYIYSLAAMRPTGPQPSAA